MDEKIEKLKEALQGMVDEYENYTDNACHCNDYGEDESPCPWCYAKQVLKEA